MKDDLSLRCYALEHDDCAFIWTRNDVSYQCICDCHRQGGVREPLDPSDPLPALAVAIELDLL